MQPTRFPQISQLLKLHLIKSLSLNTCDTCLEFPSLTKSYKCAYVSLVSDPMKPDSADSLSSKQNIRGKKISGRKTHQLRAAVVKAAQVEGDGPGPSLGPLPPSPPRGSTGRNARKHLGTV